MNSSKLVRARAVFLTEEEAVALLELSLQIRCGNEELDNAFVKIAELFREYARAVEDAVPGPDGDADALTWIAVLHPSLWMVCAEADTDALA